MLTTGPIRLRALEPEDLELVYVLENEAEQWMWGATVEPLSRHLLRQYIEQSKGDIYADGQLRLVVECEGKAIGLADLFDLSPRNRRAEVGIILLPEYRGKGFGATAIGLLADYALHFLHLRLLLAHVSTRNPSALAAFHSAGFVTIAT
ncbi:MAG: GNAT family N-acetyltransferase, partial [Bacteroidaceae bacterium]|nr:GNAT family N-acetyltransferase [Bacteroidaceae bacterium]